MRLRHWLLSAVVVVIAAFAPEASAARSANFDAFLSQPVAADPKAPPPDLRGRGLRASQAEARLGGVPTFVWATGSHAGRVSPGALGAPGTAGRAYLRSLAGVYHLTAAQVDRLPAPQVHDTGRGPKVVRFRQEVNGVEVFRNQLNVVMDPNLELVAISGYLAPGEMVDRAEVAPKLTSFALPASDAVARGFAELSGIEVGASSFVQTKSEGAGYARFALEGAAAGTFKLQDAPRARQIYFMLADRLEPAWYVELSGNGDDTPDSQMFSFVFSAQDGALLMRNSLTAEHTYRMYADPTTLLPYDGPQGNAATPHPTGTPNGYQEPWVASNLVTLNNYPFSRNDPWLGANATMTSGNNVEAYLDAAAPDGFQPATDLHATTTAPGTFDYLFNPDDSPIANNTQISAAITNLFYMNNWLHDWFYDHGFDEQWGNAQAFNYGRGGVEGDSIKAEAQDYGGRNNANMSTPADGARPRMQMYLFDGVPDLKVTAPASIAGSVAVGTASFGAVTYDVSGDVAILDPAGVTEGCSAFPAGTFNGKVALIDRGTCSFVIKAANAQSAGAVAVIIANNQPNQVPPGMGGTDPTITVPVLSVTRETANDWKTASPAVVSVQLRRIPQLDRDGTLDNGIVAHEWGHYMSNRLIGNANGLINIMGRGMGEGWSDFVAMLMQVRDEDRTRPGNDQFQGVYSVAGYALSGGASDAFYYGIRRVPYSTDFAKNALTFKHIQSGTPLPTTHPVAYGQNGASNSEVHASGEVWASMLWDCYASLLNAYPFQEAQDRMKSYLVLSYKLTPVAPTLLEARDALLAAARANDPADYARFVSAFAKRGAGLGAFGPDRNSQDLIPVVESYATGSNLYVADMKLDDVAAGCDQDGVLDVGETGNFTVTVWNTGNTTLSAFSGALTASGASASFTFPAGNTLSFPSLSPGQSASASVRAQLDGITGTSPVAGFTVTFDEPTLPASAKTATFDGALNYDEVAGSTTERFETLAPIWDRSPSSGSYQWSTTNGAYAHAPDAPQISDVVMVTPWLKVNPTGNFTFTLKHRWSFESTNGLSAPYYDGGVIELSVDGVTWYDLYLDLGIYPGYNYFLASGDNPLSDRAAFAAQSAGFPAWTTRTVNLGTMVAGENVRLRFRVGSDSGVGAYGWDIDELAFTNLANAPFASRSLEATPSGACNRRPIAIVGPPQSVAEGTLSGGSLTRTTVTVDGSGSYDPDGDPLTYQWTQTAGPAVTLTGANTASATFETDVPATLQYTFQLVVSDGIEQSLPKTVNVTVSNVNRAPVAVATGPGTVLEGSAPTVTLDGSGSSDADGEPLTYAWTQTAGPAVQLAGANTAQPTFPLPSVAADTTYTFELVVSDGIASSAASTVSVVVQNVNLPPTVNAGSDFNVAGRAPVTLTAVGGDPDGDALTYSWTQTAGPTVALTDASTATATFTSPDVKTPTALTFEVTVSDGALQATDTVVVNVAADMAPVADAGSDRNTPSRALTVLYGSGSDADGDPVTFAWTQTYGPTVTLQDENTATASFVAPSVTAATALRFQLTVTANGLTGTDTVVITVQPEGIPTADAGADQTVPGRTGVVIVGQGTSPDGSAVSYAWAQLSGAAVSLTGTNTHTLRFTSPDLKAQDVLTFQLTVSAHGQSATDTVAITVEPDGAPVADAGADLNVDARSLVTLHGSAADPEHDAVTLQWTQTLGDAVELSDATAAEPTFTAPNILGADPVELRFQLLATANGLTSADEVSVFVHRKNRVPLVAGPNDVTVDERARVTLDATATDPDGDPMAWHWVQAGGPEITLENADTASVSFTAPEVLGDTLIALQVWTTDEAGEDSAVATVRALVKNVNRAPVVTLSATGSATSGDRVVLDASGSSDADGDALTWAWKQTSGTTVTLEGSTRAVATFLAPSVETAEKLTFQVTVTDAAGVTAVKTAEVQIDPVKTASGCGCAATNDDSGWANLALLLGLGLGVIGMRRRRFFA